MISFGQAMKGRLSVGTGRDASGRNKKSSYRNAKQEIAAGLPPGLVPGSRFLGTAGRRG